MSALFARNGVCAMSMICSITEVTPAELQRLHGDAEYYEDLLDSPDMAPRTCSLEKAWHGLHYLLTGDAWGGEAPLNFIVGGGEEIEGADSGYGPPRTFSPEETRALHEAMAPITHDELWSRYDAMAMTSEGIYPTIWDEPEDDLKGEYTMYFDQAKQRIANAVSCGNGLLVSLS